MAFLEALNRFVWGYPILILLLGVGGYLSLRTGFAQLRLLPRTIVKFIKNFKSSKDYGNSVSPFRALCTALAATVGTGNIAGVAGAICLGGPGSIFWMWVSGLLGMVTKFAEVTLAVRYRRKSADGQMIGGPMYMICDGMGMHWKRLATAYAFFGVVASLGVGNATQVNAVIGGINSAIVGFGGKESVWGNVLMGLGLASLIGCILLGGARRIGEAAEKLVPIASAIYLLLGAGVLMIRCNYLPSAFKLILQGAFKPKAVTGGMIGSFVLTLNVGIRRGIFTNEAGMGTASMAHATAITSHPVEQGMMGIFEVFLDTIVICTMTALVILCSSIPIDYGVDSGVALTAIAFSSVYGSWVNILLSAALVCFAIATILGWGLYGMRCVQFLFGEHLWRYFAWIQIVMVFLGAVLNTGIVWVMAEILNGLMAIPNMIALMVLNPEFLILLRAYNQLQIEKKY